MKASQYLYTSYKNSPNGGYAIYSMSSDISQEDAKVIFLLMQYPAVPMLSDTRRKLNNMTWNPVDISEIENICPRNFAFFKLPSGKYCIAEAGYIGPEFKGFVPSGRTGNYLIHAFVVDSLEKFPILYMSEKFFRHDLTIEEWTAKNPAPLPQVDIDTDKGFSQQEITQFLNSGNNKYYVSSLATALKNGHCINQIYINDKLENARLWISCISLLLGKEFASKVFFNTYSYDDSNLKLGLPEGSKYSIQYIIGSSSRMKLQQKIMTGLVIDLVNNQFSPNMSQDELITAGVDLLSRDIYAVPAFIENVERVKTTYGVDTRNAIRIIEMEKTGIDSYSVSEALELLTIYSKGPSIVNYVAPVFEKIFSLQYPKSMETLSLAKLLYKYLDSSTKDKYVRFVFEDYINTQTSDSNAYINDAKAKYDFIYKDFARVYPLCNEGENLLVNNSTNKGLTFLYLDSLLLDPINVDKTKLYEILIKLCETNFTSGNIDYSLSLVNKVSSLLPSLKSDLYKSICEKTDIKAAETYLPYLKEITDINYVANRLYKMIISCDDKKKVLNLYRDFLSNNPSMSRIDSVLSIRDDIIAIIEQVEIQDFAATKYVDNNTLLTFFKKYYLTNKDTNNLFAKAFNNRFTYSSYTMSDISFWVNTFNTTRIKQEDAGLYSILLNNLISVAGKNISSYRTELDILKRLGATRSDVEVELFAKELFAKKEFVYKQELLNKTLYSYLFNGIDEENKKEIFAREHLNKFVVGFLKCKTLSFMEDAQYLASILEPFSSDSKYLNKVLNIFDTERIEEEKLLVILFCISKLKEPFTPHGIRMFNFTLQQMNDKRKKELSNYIVKNVKNDKDPLVYEELMVVAAKLNPKNNVKVAAGNPNQPINPKPNPESQVPPQNGFSHNVKQEDLTNTNAQSNANTNTNKESNEKKGFFHNLFHKKK